MKTDTLPGIVRVHDIGKDGSKYAPNFMLTANKNPQPINLTEYCTHIANVPNTFVTCIQSEWYEDDWYKLGNSKDQEEK